MARIFYQQDCDLQKLSGKTVAIIGYGSQGHAHALNLKDSGVNVVVGLYKGSKSWAKAESQGLKVMKSAEAAKAAVEEALRRDSQAGTHGTMPNVAQGSSANGGANQHKVTTTAELNALLASMPK